MSTKRGAWQPGDRVRVLLPNTARRGRGTILAEWVPGTVREVDPAGLPPGVGVDLDYVINDVQTCFATHEELRPEGTDEH